MTTPPPYGSVPSQPQGYPPPGQPAPGAYPNTGATPAPGYGQPQYGQQPPAYGQQPGYAQPAYPAAPGFAPAGYGAPMAARRPGMVTAAAVLAFIWGAFAIIGGLIIMAASSIVSSASAYCNSLTTTDATTVADCNTVSGYSGTFKAIAGALAVVAILLIWGGVVALTGKNAQILVIGAAVFILLQIVELIISATSSGSFYGTGIIGIVAPVLMLIFMLNPASKAWFRSKGAKTF
ncbi:hypothetical protein SAMN04515671_0261 [Nakamurella panacisegetis]|uniref:Uncharacterized protein n=1 Tax=Nakamurella panacisegetis TaxID=1090615 RepID=A0A1H0HXM6_9ACTN|nr:hypothetical protein [Nakamurella panacisegetis]SDO23914.1 hypothetical protein SAMN04515671_0261 [Nakamurella panacisegetis]